jgi:hypothetical protein
MNKYNVRAIRNELDGYIRNASWKKFRTRLQGLEDVELRRAVITHRPTANSSSGRKKRNSTTLLHALCDCVRSTPPVPVDLLESIVEACPELLSGTIFSFRTPLSIALDRQAAPTILECLLLHDTERRSLYLVDGKTGDTPILQAIKQQASDDVILLLVDYDTTKESLLIPSKKRQKVPLFYVANQELSFVHLEAGGDEDIPGELEYMLLQTHQALQIQKGQLVPTTSTPSRKACTSQQWNDVGDEEDLDLNGLLYGDYIDQEGEEEVGDDNYLFLDGDSEDKYCARLLQAVFACAHFLGDKHSISLISYLLSRIPDLSNAVHNDNTMRGNTMLHCLCQATHVFAQSNLLEGRLMTETILRRHEQSAETANRDGNLPLHAALETKKPWEDVLKPLLDAVPETISMANTRTGRLPLHLAISNYPSRAKEIHTLWKLFPEAAAIQDPLTRLFPFQLAAAAALSNETSPTPAKQSPPQEQEDSEASSSKRRKPVLATTAKREPVQKDLDQISDIFFLLRASPQVLREFVV